MNERNDFIAELESWNLESFNASEDLAVHSAASWD